MKTYNKKSGFSVLEMSIALGVSMAVAAGAVAIFTRQSQQLRSQQTQMGRNAVKSALDEAIHSYEALRATASANVTANGRLLNNCFFPDNLQEAADENPYNCNIVPGQQYPVPLYYAQRDRATGQFPANFTQADRVLAGGDGPVYYRLDGTRCDGLLAQRPHAECPLMATASFSGNCAHNDALCGRAQTITLRYVLQRDPRIAADPVLAKEAPEFQTVNGTYTFPMDQLADDAAVTCPTGNVAISWGANGPANCKDFNTIRVQRWNDTTHAYEWVPVSTAFTDTRYRSPQLVGGLHTQEECVQDGGTYDGATNACKFAPPGNYIISKGGNANYNTGTRTSDPNSPISPCPNGWTMLGNWSETYDYACLGGSWVDQFPSRDWSYSGIWQLARGQIPNVVCDLGPTAHSSAHGWSDVPREVPANVYRRTSCLRWVTIKLTRWGPRIRFPTDFRNCSWGCSQTPASCSSGLKSVACY